MLPANRYRFDGITLDVAAMRLARGGEELSLEPKSFRLLQFLIENRDRVLGKEEIFRVVWQETAVTDNALTRAIAQIRKVLDDDPKQPRYIETVPTVGYRFIAVLDANAPTPVLAPAAIPVSASVAGLAPGKKWSVLALAGIAMVLLAGVGLVGWKLRPKPALAPVSMPIPLTTYRGSQDGPSFSPDGNQVAFDWDGEQEDNEDIYVKALGPDATPLRLTTNPAPDWAPAWSPDGATIAFLREVTPNLVDVMLIPALGGPERKLAEFPYVSSTFGLRASWSPDNKWLILAAVSSGEVTSLFRVSVETGESLQITHPASGLEDSFAAISPDGATLVFTRHTHLSGISDIYEMSLDANAKPVEEARLLHAGGDVSRMGYLAWMPDGKEILSATGTGADRLRADGSGSLTAVPWMVGRGRGLAMSMRGNRFAYTVVQGDANIWRIDLTVKSPQPERLVASTGRDVFPEYSPDGTRLAYYSSRTGTAQIYVSESDGKQPHQMTFVKKGQASTPHWSPDGRTLGFDSSQSGAYQVYTMDANGGAMKQLTQGPAANFRPTWSRDGRTMYFGSQRTGRTEILKMPSGGGPATQVTHNGGENAIESFDGKTLYYGKEAGAGSIWKMPIAGGPEELVVDSVYRANFAVTRSGIYYMTYPGDDAKALLKFYSFATGKATTILPIGIAEYGLDVSPDGRYLAYAQLDDPGSVLMMVENFR